MRFQILHESRGRVRLRAVQPSMTMEQADLLEAWLLNQPGVEQATVHERICGVIIVFRGVRAELYDALAAFSYEKAAQQTRVLSRNSRAINREYKQKLVMKVVRRYLKKLFLPLVFRRAINACLAVPRIWRALRVLCRGRLTVDVLDGVAIGVSLLTGDFSTAGSVRFLLGVGETLDEWTHKKSVDDLAKSMSLQVDQVWLQRGDGEQTLVPLDSVQPGDRIVIHTGHVLPMDGILEQGDVMLNQASLTGESVPVAKRVGSAVYAGSVVEEGNCIVRVTGSVGENRYDRIVRMIEESERLKSGAESRAYDLADRLVPWCLGGSLLTWLLTGNTTRAVSVLMVDFSCALKLSMPLSVLSAMREAGRYKITVKGGKYLEKLSKADTVIFDKTGTLTHACPTVHSVIAFNGQEEAEMLRVGCMGELGMPLMWAWIIVLLLIGELVRKLVGYEKRSSIRICVPLMSLVPMGNLAPLFLTKTAFLQRASEEMDAAYVSALDRYGTVWMFLAVLVLAVVLAAVSERISEKILKIRE